MQSRVNSRGHPEHFVVGHLKLEDLKKVAKGLDNQYLIKENIPAAPRPEFHVTRLKHDTDRDGLRGIKKDSGFKNPAIGSLVWWSLAVGPDEISSAETRLLEATYPERTAEQVERQPSFLKHFTTSPAFMEPSRLGSYRFTFTLEEVLEAYSQQFCSGAPPVMRRFETVLYKQEVMHVVVVHSQANEELFSGHRLLTDDSNSLVTYRDGCFIWRPEAMCETHNYRLLLRPEKKQMEAERVMHQFYVWDHVAVALHVDDQVLDFDADRLRENLKFCSRAIPSITDHSKFDYFTWAGELVKTLWPNCSAALERCDQ